MQSKEPRDRVDYKIKLAQQPFSLSKKEIEVARLLIAGKDIKAIAGNMNIKIKTVDSHIGMIYSKLGITNAANICKRSVAIMKLKDVL